MIRLIPQPQKIIGKNGFCTDESKKEYIKNAEMKEESYSVLIKADGIKITAKDERGFFYADKTLEQMKGIYSPLPCAEIYDEPAFSHRAFMLDSARHMIDVDEIKKMVDIASELKMNKFHWHLSDDQGFRIELKSYPQLTKLGSVRKCDNFGSMCRSDKEYSGYYTRAEIKEVIDYCSERFIEVIPEIDMPGHTSAILHVFPEISCRKLPVEVKTRQGIYKDNLCIGNEKTEEFLHNLIDEICEIFPSEMFHIGGDESPDDYRKNCPLCQQKIKENNLENSAELQCLFAEKISEYLKSKGKKAIVWNDILKGGMVNEDITVQRWLDPKKNGFKAANSGNKVIISDFKPYYFDYPYGMYPLKNVYKHNPVGAKELTEKGRENIIGIETPLWTEFVDSAERIEYLCLPRWFAFSENAWTNVDKKSYKNFKKTLEKLAEIYKKKGYNFAEKNEWDMPIFKRLYDTLNFFKKFLAK